MFSNATNYDIAVVGAGLEETLTSQPGVEVNAKWDEIAESILKDNKYVDFYDSEAVGTYRKIIIPTMGAFVVAPSGIEAPTSTNVGVRINIGGDTPINIDTQTSNEAMALMDTLVNGLDGPYLVVTGATFSSMVSATVLVVTKEIKSMKVYNSK
jgi:hypothetical protein